MWEKFKFDYDFVNDNLFLYNPKIKSKGSVEIDDLIVDFDAKKNVSGIELLNASRFFKDITIEEKPINKKMLKEIEGCKLEILTKNNFLVIKLVLLFKSKRIVKTPLLIPRIKKSSPSLR